MTDTLQPAQTDADAINAFEQHLSELLDHCPTYRRDWPTWQDGLPQRDRHLLAVQGLHGQVCNGGFAQWIGNGYFEDDGATLQLALARMPQGGMVEQIEGLLRQADRAVEAGFDARLHHLSDEACDALDPLDDAYYAVSDEFQVVFARYFMGWV